MKQKWNDHSQSFKWALNDTAIITSYGSLLVLFWWMNRMMVRWLQNVLLSLYDRQMVFVNLEIRGNISLINQKKKTKSRIQRKFGCRILDPSLLLEVIKCKSNKRQTCMRVWSCAKYKAVLCHHHHHHYSIQFDSIQSDNWFVHGEIEINHSCNRTLHKYQRIHRWT